MLDSRPVVIAVLTCGVRNHGDKLGILRTSRAISCTYLHGIVPIYLSWTGLFRWIKNEVMPPSAI